MLYLQTSSFVETGCLQTSSFVETGYVQISSFVKTWYLQTSSFVETGYLGISSFDETGYFRTPRLYYRRLDFGIREFAHPADMQSCLGAQAPKFYVCAFSLWLYPHMSQTPASINRSHPDPFITVADIMTKSVEAPICQQRLSYRGGVNVGISQGVEVSFFLHRHHL